MMLEWSSLLCVFGTGLFFILITKQLFRWFHSEADSKLPPLEAGWIPWVGCAIEFGKMPLAFIEMQRRKHGSIFTMKVAGERMTFLMDPADFHLFFSSPKVDFKKAVLSTVMNVASITKQDFMNNHTKIHDAIKGRLSGPSLSALFPGLYERFQSHLDTVCKSGDSVEPDLFILVRRSMSRAVLENLFGKGVLPIEDEAEFMEFEERFLIYDEYFEFGAKLPHVFLKQWTASKRWFLDLFSEILKNDNNSDVHPLKQNILQTLLSHVEGKIAPNCCLLILWASLANAIPVTFWTLSQIFNNPDVLSRVQKEVQSVLSYSGKINGMTESDLLKLTYIRQCVLETIRLQSPGLVARRVVKDLTASGYKIPAGDLVLLSPFWTHRNPDIFPEPEKFMPERWENADKNSIPENLIAFGGGRFQCPGRWFALMEIQLYVCMFVSKFNCELQNGIPTYGTLHLVGTQNPAAPCPAVLSRRKNS